MMEETRCQAVCDQCGYIVEGATPDDYPPYCPGCGSCADSGKPYVVPDPRTLVMYGAGRVFWVELVNAVLDHGVTKYNQSMQVRRFGEPQLMATCKTCGNAAVPTANNQWVCPKCSGIEIFPVDRSAARPVMKVPRDGPLCPCGTITMLQDCGYVCPGCGSIMGNLRLMCRCGGWMKMQSVTGHPLWVCPSCGERRNVEIEE